MLGQLFGERLPLILQREGSECGLVCLTMLLNFHGKLFGVDTLREVSGLSSRGASVKDLLTAAERMQLRGRALKLDLEDIGHLTLPAVLHWDMDHFVVLKRVGLRRVTIHDPAVGVKHYARAELSRHFTGIAVEFQPGDEFVREKDEAQPRLGFLQLLRGMPGLAKCLLPLLLLSILIQSLALLAPLYLQLVIDQGIIKGDLSLVLMLALVFGVLMLARVLLNHMRGLLLLITSNQLGFRLVSETFHHLLRLPLSYFERRELGDVVSRFGALDKIKQLVTSEMITVLVDGIFSLLTVILLFLYQPMLAAISLSAVFLHSLVRLLTLLPEHKRRLEVVELEARQQTRFMEDIRSIATVKLNGMELQRESDWLQRYSQFINSGFRLGRLQLGMMSAETVILGVENLLIIFLASQLVADGELTLGQMMSFIFLKQHFLGSILAMVPKLGELRLMRLELDRVADIRLAKKEPALQQPTLFAPLVSGHIVLRDVGFTYPGGRSPVLEAFTAEIPPTRVTVIAGPSGCGKSTLLKLILGLEEMQAGSLTVDGWSHAQRCPRRFREQVAALLHDEGLLAGTLGFNVTLGVDCADQNRLEDACRAAGIAELIASLPMGYATRVGELGSQFSAGQIRRVLIARALYRRPRLLLLDETLTHLGQQAALEVLEYLREQRITTIVVSHDPVITANADHRITLAPVSTSPATQTSPVNPAADRRTLHRLSQLPSEGVDEQSNVPGENHE